MDKSVNQDSNNIVEAFIKLTTQRRHELVITAGDAR